MKNLVWPERPDSNAGSPVDETTVRVLDPGRGKTKTGYMWTMARDERAWSGADPPGVIYEYAPGRSGKHGETLLEGFQGTVQSLPPRRRGRPHQIRTLRPRMGRPHARCRYPANDNNSTDYATKRAA